ncbi:hypothetical protein [Clostridium botulinum]|uniref:hypothetical protein n=1 Tax=Clostridium botulinum TaxID=1491 RepID=UPI0004DAD710|nr:hypothetical protein [Clostridium botulinum]KEH90496.1 hypothetical protein Z963_p0053 [Clostridium botulinum C/D str. It1]
MAAEKFYYVEGATSVKDIIKNITKEITQKATTYKWDLVYPESVETIKDFSLIKATTSSGQTFYVRFERNPALTPSGEEQKLLDKEKYSQAFTEDDIKLLNRYVESMPFSSNEKALIKKKSEDLDEKDQQLMQELRMRKNIINDRELTLLQKYFNGDRLDSGEQNEYDSFQKAHELQSQEIKDWNNLKTNRKLYSDGIILIMYKQYGGLELTNSEKSSLASYRQQMELSQKEKEKLALLKGQMDNRNHMYITFGKDIHKTNKIIQGKSKQEEIQVQDLVKETCSVPARFAWYKALPKEIGEWLPVQYWITQTKDSINIVLRGDPSADNYPYNNYLTSYAYIGALKALEEDSEPDREYNFGVTTSSDIEPFFIKKFGDRTATGITDVCMCANKIGMPMQPHYPAFYTSDKWMDKCNVEGSRWNHKKHTFSDITLVHSIDMERGKMENVLIGDSSALYDTDKITYHRGKDDEEHYKKFTITAPYNFLNNSANILYCIGIRCTKEAE